jgi:mRNA deadenylase 3'-5' endonuclease subunit Ccr4
MYPGVPALMPPQHGGPRRGSILAEPEPQPGTLRVMSYNVLAPSYAFPARYAYCNPADLESEVRLQKTMAQLAHSHAHVICLQVRLS